MLMLIFVFDFFCFREIPFGKICKSFLQVELTNLKSNVT